MEGRRDSRADGECLGAPEQRSEGCEGIAANRVPRPDRNNQAPSAITGVNRRRARRGELLAGCLATVQPQVLEDAADDLRVFDAGDDLHRPAAAFTGLDLDTEDAFEALRPSHRGVLGHRTALPFA